MYKTFYLSLFLMLLSTSNGLIEISKTVSPYHWVGHYTNFEKFGFDVGGRLEISGTINSKSQDAFIFITRHGDTHVEGSESGWISALCVDTDPTLWMAKLDGKKHVTQISIRGKFLFHIIDCTATSWEAQITYAFNSTADGNQLSYEDIPLPLFYLVLMGLWAMLLCVWTIVLYRNVDSRVPIHFVMWGVLLLKEVVVCMITFYWWMYSTQGYRYDIFYTLLNFLFAFPETVFFCALYLIAKGWRITRGGLPAAEIRSTFVALLVLLSTLLFFSFYNTEYYWLSLLLMYFFMLPRIFTAISHNVRTLDSHVTAFQQTARASTTETAERFLEVLAAKRNLFSKIRHCLVGYLVAILLVNSILRVLTVWELAWISRMSDEAVVFFIVAIILYLLRPSRKVFYTRAADMRPMLLLQTWFRERMEEENENTAGALEPWDMGKTLVVEWPDTQKRREEGRGLTRVHMSLAYEAGYALQQESKGGKEESDE